MSAGIPPDIEERLVDERLVAHLATCRDGRPHVAPLWFRYDDGVVEIMTTGRKLENVRNNPRVALSVQEDEGGLPRWTVTLRGTATIVEDEDAAREANRRLNRKYGVEEDAWSGNELVRIHVGSATHRTYE
ncbi:pyridoxamine 5'-phosphate oxidase family protein [Halorarum salinum]|uniref:Pyridoxamine 5'-phosphate oxidase family protein n=1 Tax=Halorarum salinum TaxID=2743089 RepID=A0A7D5QC27_9EURY|nr:pyridoxamine 5'-phosphate oxidase family protein [Halobaculum salinum]QLG62320.1 pyridoxamine 5'-phosphate oxidase family protein [Halobaculum salinum]